MVEWKSQMAEDRSQHCSLAVGGLNTTQKRTTVCHKSFHVNYLLEINTVFLRINTVSQNIPSDTRAYGYFLKPLMCGSVSCKCACAPQTWNLHLTDICQLHLKAPVCV